MTGDWEKPGSVQNARRAEHLKLFKATVPLLCCAGITFAQGIRNHRLYDRSRDQAAQQAAEAAKRISSGSLFEKELKNLDALSKLEIDSAFQGEGRVLRNAVDTISFSTWAAIDGLVKLIEAQLQTEPIKTNILDLQARRDLLQERLKDLQTRPAPAQSAPPESAELVAGIINQGLDADKAAAALVAASKKGDAGSQALLEALGKILAEGKTAADAVAANQKNVTTVAAQLQQLRLSLSGLAVQRLQVELGHTAQLLKIWERALRDVNKTLQLIGDYRAQSKRGGIDPQRTVMETIRTAGGPAVLDAALQSAFLASAIAARWNSADLVARLREAQEQHRYSIRRSQLEAHAYEVAIGSGAQRLSMFYKGGIRPEIIAQILYAAATASISGTIAATN